MGSIAAAPGAVHRHQGGLPLRYVTRIRRLRTDVWGAQVYLRAQGGLRLVGVFAGSEGYARRAAGLALLLADAAQGELEQVLNRGTGPGLARCGQPLRRVSPKKPRRGHLKL